MKFIVKTIIKILLISIVFVGLMSINAEAYSLDNNLLVISENFNEENPVPAIVIEEEVAIQEDPAWTYRFLIPISVAIATLVIVGNVIQYFRQVTKKRYKVIEK